MKYLLPFVLPLLLLLASSCKKGTVPTQPDVQLSGYVRFQLLKSSIPSDVALISVALERPGMLTIEDSVEVSSAEGDTVTLLVENIPIGIWKLTVRAKDDHGIVRYVGTEIVAIESNQTTVVSVLMQEVDSGTGSLLIHVLWGCVPVPGDVRGWWKGDGTTLDTRSGLPATFHGQTSYGAGVVDLAFSFDGSSYVEIDDTSWLDITSSFTISLWFRLSVPLAEQPDFLGPSWNDFPFLIEKGSGGYTDRNYGIYFDKWKDQLAFDAIDTTREQFVFSVVVPAIGAIVDDLQWHHLAAVWDQDLRVASILIDGQVRGISAGSGIPMFANDEGLRFGAAAQGTYYFKGSMDEIVLLDTPLSVSTLQKIYLAHSRGICP